MCCIDCIRRRLPFMCAVKGTVIVTIWWKVLLVTVYTAALVYANNYVDEVKGKIDFPMKLVTLLGVVIGLLLVFRNNTAYDRYWEGRKLWGTMTYNIRTMARSIWVMVNETGSQDVVDKVSVINLLVAFAYATRNYLREEYSYHGRDLPQFIAHLPQFSKPGNKSDSVESLEPPSNTSSPGSGWKGRPYTWSRMKAYDHVVPANIPIEITFYVASYIKKIQQRQAVDSATISTMNSALNTMVDTLGGFERILRTPIPLAYSVHLHHVTWIYIMALPYQLIGDLSWYSIPTVAIASFALFGMLAIGWEIENPFGRDDNDLPLSNYCHVLHKEILRIIGHAMPTPESWLHSELNHPCAPGLHCNLTATDLAEMTDSDLRAILSKSRPKPDSMRNGEDTEFKSISIVEDITDVKTEHELMPMVDNPSQF